MSWFNVVTIVVSVVLWNIVRDLWRSRRRKQRRLPHVDNLNALREAVKEADATTATGLAAPGPTVSRSSAILEFYRKTAAQSARTLRKVNTESGKRSGIVVEFETPPEFVREIWGASMRVDLEAIYTVRVRLDEEDRWAAWTLDCNGITHREGIGAIEATT